MVSITLSVPEEVKQKMDTFQEINWSGFIRQHLIEKTNELNLKEKLLKKFEEEEKFTEWSLKMGSKVNEGIAKRLKKEGLL